MRAVTFRVLAGLLAAAFGSFLAFSGRDPGSVSQPS